MSKRDRLNKWAEKLTAEQMHKALVDLVDYAIDAEEVHFYDDSLAPFWQGDGEPIVEGQKAYPDW